MSDSSNHQYSSGTEFEAARLRTHDGYGEMTRVCKLGQRAKILNCKLAQESTVASSGFNPVGSSLLAHKAALRLLPLSQHASLWTAWSLQRHNERYSLGNVEKPRLATMTQAAMTTFFLSSSVRHKEKTAVTNWNPRKAALIDRKVFLRCN